MRRKSANLLFSDLKEVTLVFSPNFELISYFPITELTACLVYGRRPGLKLRVELHRPGIEHSNDYPLKFTSAEMECYPNVGL